MGKGRKSVQLVHSFNIVVPFRLDLIQSISWKQIIFDLNGTNLREIV